MDYLTNGISVVIDDEVFSEGTKIFNVVKDLENLDFPLLRFSKIPNDNVSSNFKSISFVILDWNFQIKDDNGDPIKETPELKEARIGSVLIFIEYMQFNCYCPIFIFSQELIPDIADVIKEYFDWSNEDFENSSVFVKSKTELGTGEMVIAEVKKWIENNLSMYVLKEWEYNYQQSKNEMFTQFSNLSPNWPKTFWDNFELDGGNKSYEMRELISKNLFSRISPFSFNEDIFNSIGETEFSKDEIRAILEGEKFLDNSKLDDGYINTGDLFLINNKSGVNEYYLNIRPQCDLVRGEYIDDTDLFLIKGFPIHKNEINDGKKGIKFHQGQFLEIANNVIIPFVDNGVLVNFKFKKFSIQKWKDMKDFRVGMILPPHIINVQQKFSYYLQRQGLSRIPEIAK